MKSQELWLKWRLTITGLPSIEHDWLFKIILSVTYCYEECLWQRKETDWQFEEWRKICDKNFKFYFSDFWTGCVAAFFLRSARLDKPISESFSHVLFGTLEASEAQKWSFLNVALLEAPREYCSCHGEHCCWQLEHIALNEKFKNWFVGNFPFYRGATKLFVLFNR